MAKTDEPEKGDGAASHRPRKFNWRRWLPLMVIVTAMAIVFAQGWHQLLSPRSVAESRESLQGYVQAHMAEALGLYMLTYAVVVALSLPVAAILTILGGFLFGPLLGGGAVVFAATAGAIAVFLAAKTALGDLLAERSGRVIKRMRQGFQENALSYMFFLRLVPAFPLWLVNIAPALLGVRLRTYVIGTFFGIIPGTFAYAYVGGGLDSILVKARSDPEFQACIARERVGEIPEGSCSLDLDFGDFITPELILAFVLLGVVALIPAVWRAVRRKRTTPE